ncbi:MAG: class II aldolase/adducin family protein [Rhizobiales bacterium]|nr:class II aldolase/adducin family protein [Hyphomicrobiales bacterium]
MQSLWKDVDAEVWRAKGETVPGGADLALRVYTSRLIGQEPDLVLHGGGNTSVKVADGGEEVLYVKGSGWDLATIEAPGLPGVALQPLLAVREGGRLSDPEMVGLLRRNMIDQSGPNPSVETLLHAFLPARYVDHTHSAAALAIANQPNAADLSREIFGDRLVVVPYVMPGFDLAVAADRCFREAGGEGDGLFLVNHGLFAFHDDPRLSYERIIAFTTACEAFLDSRGAALAPPEATTIADEGLRDRVLAALGAALRRHPVFAAGPAFDLRATASIGRFLALPDFAGIVGRGTVTPDHVIRLKPKPLIGEAAFTGDDWARAIDAFAADYAAYFERNARNADEPKIMLDPMPRVALVRGLGLVGIGRNAKEAGICADLAEQAVRVMLSAERIGRFTPIGERDLFDMEYWSLEQAKLKVA